MIDIKPSIVLEDSRGGRYFFYYKDSSIYYREVSSTGDTKDTILISQANIDFTAAIDTDDTIYLTCNSRYKGVLLFIYANNGWKFEPVVTLHNSSNIYIMDMLVLNGSIHIFFSKKLPVANMYNVYHIHKNINEQAPYIEYSWRKNSLSEIYSQNIENSYSLLPSKGGLIHYTCVWYDGTHYYINYYCYDDSTKSWLQKSLNISYKNHVFVKLLQHNKRINLLCFSNEGEASNIHHFTSKSSGAGEIDFKELNNSHVDTSGTTPLFYSDDKALQLAWVKDNSFHQYTFDDSSGRWRKAIDLPVSAEINMLLIKIVRSSSSTSITKGYFLLDKNYNISRPIEHSSRNVLEDKLREKPQAPASTETSDYLKQILGEIKDLSENIKYLNNRIENLESKSFGQKASQEEQTEVHQVKSKAAANVEYERTPLNKSNFKEKFMKSGKTPNYDSLLMKQDSITTFVGKPGVNQTIGDIPYENKAKAEASANEKHAYASPGAASQRSSI
ncbi:MAG TPA: hypothetical protein VEF53_09330, partial [Patescibacteria group bacterium]|nr:hypothetical protein [Patescibacteria group bacterium]